MVQGLQSFRTSRLMFTNVFGKNIVNILTPEGLYLAKLNLRLPQYSQQYLQYLESGMLSKLIDRTENNIVFA